LWGTHATWTHEGARVSWTIAPSASITPTRVFRTLESPWFALAPASGELTRDGATVTFADSAAALGRDYVYWLAGVDAAGRTKVFGPVSLVTRSQVPGVALLPVAPNPARGGCRFEYEVNWSVVPGETHHVRLRVIDLAGRVVATPIDGVAASGRHFIDWAGRSEHGPVPAGVYFAMLEIDTNVWRQRFVLVR
jgi:hypothetical protein